MNIMNLYTYAIKILTDLIISYDIMHVMQQECVYLYSRTN